MKKWIIGLAALFAGAVGWVTGKRRRRKTTWIEVVDADRTDTQVNDRMGKEY